MSSTNRIPYGKEVPPGRFRCADCGYELAVTAGRPLPPCPLFDDGHNKNCWLPQSALLPANEPAEAEPHAAGNRKRRAVDLAMAVISDLLTEGASIRVESHPLSRSRPLIRRQLESFSSGAFVLAIFPNGGTEYFDIMYKCRRDIAIVEYSNGLKRVVEESIAKTRVDTFGDRRRSHPAANGSPAAMERSF